jgi:hypothetical protein
MERCEMQTKEKKTVLWISPGGDSEMEVPEDLLEAAKNFSEIAVTLGGEELIEERYVGLVDGLLHIVCASATAFVSISAEGDISYEAIKSQKGQEAEDLAKKGQLLTSAMGMMGKDLPGLSTALYDRCILLREQVLQLAISFDPVRTIKHLLHSNPVQAIAIASKMGAKGIGEICDCPECQKARSEGGSDPGETQVPVPTDKNLN